MPKITKIDVSDLDKKFKLCFISPVCVKIGGQSFNDNYEDLVLFFAPDNKDLNVSGARYCRFHEPPKIDREYQILIIKNFISVDIDGTEFRSYQQDNWLTADYLYREAHTITAEKINNGAGCWLYNEDKKIAISSHANIDQVRKIFKKYILEFYSVKPDSNIEENESKN